MREFVMFFASVVLFFVVVIASGAAGAGVTTIQALDFGEWLSYNNDQVYEITINTDSTYSYDSDGFVMLTAPQEGIYDITDLTPNASVSSVVASQNQALTHGTGSFQMDTFQTSNGSTVGSDGVLRVWVGATANTSGNSTAYIDATYSGYVDITVNY